MDFNPHESAGVDVSGKLGQSWRGFRNALINKRLGCATLANRARVGWPELRLVPVLGAEITHFSFLVAGLQTIVQKQSEPSVFARNPA